jgi:hypothetical protein
MSKFHGSYLETDVQFLLKEIEIEETKVSKKEKEIQSGRKHYSEMISKEYLPSAEYLEVFHNSMKRNLGRFAQDILNFATLFPKNSVIVSLARAGTPIGVIVKRVIAERFGIDLPHYSISIIRDREIDENALKYISKKHKDLEIRFVDGWTGKGVIGKELMRFVKSFNFKNRMSISSKLYVISDISGKADFSVSNSDYMIPSSALNSTISGLVSRTVLNRNILSKDDFHGCKFYKEFQKEDLSLWFVEQVVKESRKLKPNLNSFLPKNLELEKRVEKFLADTITKYKSSRNYIKPGIAETTRVLLRRIPEIVLVKDRNSLEISHLLHLASEKGVEVLEVESLPYSAVGVIKMLGPTK